MVIAASSMVSPCWLLDFNIAGRFDFDDILLILGIDNGDGAVFRSGAGYIENNRIVGKTGDVVDADLRLDIEIFDYFFSLGIFNGVAIERLVKNDAVIFLFSNGQLLGVAQIGGDFSGFRIQTEIGLDFLVDR